VFYADVQPDFAGHFLEMRCKGTTFFRTCKTFPAFFIKIPKKSSSDNSSFGLKQYLCALKIPYLY